MVEAKTYRPWQNMTSRYDLISTGHLLLRVSLTTIQKSNLYTTLIKQNTTGNKCIISHSQNTTALQPHVFLNGIHRLLTGHIQGAVVFPSSVKKMPGSTANSGVTVYLTLTGNHNCLSDQVTRPPFSDAIGNKFFSPLGGDKPQ